MGKARVATKDETIQVLVKGGEQGCPHVVSLVPDKPLELCNTCLDCCVLWQREKIGIETIRKLRTCSCLAVADFLSYNFL